MKIDLDLARLFRRQPGRGPIADVAADAAPTASRRQAGGRALPDTSGPFGALASLRRPAVVLDVENLHYSARDIGCRVDFAALAAMIRSGSPGAELHAVLSVVEGQHGATRDQAAAAGWIGHTRPLIREAVKGGGNADTTMALVVGHVLARLRPDALVIGTGDGALGLDIARKARDLERGLRLVATLSLPHSTSGLLVAGRGSAIDRNLHVGRDVLHPVGGPSGPANPSIRPWRGGLSRSAGSFRRSG